MIKRKLKSGISVAIGITMRFINSTFEPKYDFARSISRLVQPIIITIPIFVILNYFVTGGTGFLIFTLICLLFATFLPFTAVWMWIKNRDLDLDITDKDERTFSITFWGFIIPYWYSYTFY